MQQEAIKGNDHSVVSQWLRDKDSDGANHHAAGDLAGHQDNRGHRGHQPGGAMYDWMNDASDEEIEIWLQQEAHAGTHHPLVSNWFRGHGAGGIGTMHPNGPRGNQPGGTAYDWLNDASDEAIETWLETEDLAGHRHPALRQWFRGDGPGGTMHDGGIVAENGDRTGPGHHHDGDLAGEHGHDGHPPGGLEYAWLHDASDGEIRDWLQQEALAGTHHPAVSSWFHGHGNHAVPNGKAPAPAAPASKENNGGDAGKPNSNTHTKAGNDGNSNKGAQNNQSELVNSNKGAQKNQSELVSAKALEPKAANEEVNSQGNANVFLIVGMFLVGTIVGHLANGFQHRTRQVKEAKAKETNAVHDLKDDDTFTMQSEVV